MLLDLPPIAVTQAEAIDLIRSQKIFRRALRARWITPVIQGGLGRASIYDYGDVVKLWERLKTGDMPPKLPSELKGSVRKFFGQLWDALRGVAPEPEPIYVFCSRKDIEKEMAEKYGKAHKEQEKEEIEKEKQKMQKNALGREEEPMKVEVDPNLF